MNPLALVAVLRDMQGKAFRRLPWASGRPTKRIALAPHRGREQDWFPASPALYEAVRELGAKLRNFHTTLSDLEAACKEHGIEGER